jgi:hypothetical protein
MKVKIDDIGEIITFNVHKMAKSILTAGFCNYYTLSELKQELKAGRIKHNIILWAYNRTY